MLKLRINPLVAEDLKGIRDYIAEDSEKYADKIISKLYKRFELIQSLPGIGSNLSKRVRFMTEHKYVVWENYVIVYKVNDEYVEIHRVINRYQDITRIFE